MAGLVQTTERRIEHWEHRLTLALEDTSAEEEKRRLEGELAELERARRKLRELEPEELQRLHDRLQQDPGDWLEHHFG